jgi:hypothetical protein
MSSDTTYIKNVLARSIFNYMAVYNHLSTNISVKTIHKTIRHAALATKEIHKTIENIILSSMAQATIFNEIFVIGEDFISQTIIGFFNGNGLLYR